MSVDAVGAAYAARAAEYIDLFGSIDAAADRDRRDVLAWAQGLRGPVLDVGCGPGQWTHFLHEHGVDVEGIDPVPEFVERARQQHPEVRCRVASIESLAVAEGSLGGVLAWFSLIHADPDEIDPLLARVAAWVRPGGGLLVGFFEGPELVPFDHAVTTAWFWPAPELSSRIERAGFQVLDVRTRTHPGGRAQGTLVAERG